MSSSSFGNAPGMHLQDLILDTKATATNEQKVECLKLLRIVVKNLSDPTKAQDSKYRQLRLSNEKVKQKLLPCPSAIAYMKSIGFEEGTDETDGTLVLRIPPSNVVNVLHMKAALSELSNAIDMVSPNSFVGQTPVSRKSSTNSISSMGEEKKTPEGIIIRRSDSSVSTSSTNSGSRMSEKQKARRLLEEKKQREAEEVKKERARNVALLKRDKYVRENDENWTSGVSAACMKSGDGISTFRDRHGENN